MTRNNVDASLFVAFRLTQPHPVFVPLGIRGEEDNTDKVEAGLEQLTLAMQQSHVRNYLNHACLKVHGGKNKERKRKRGGS